MKCIRYVKNIYGYCSLNSFNMKVFEKTHQEFLKKNTVSSMKKSSRMFLLYSYDVFGETTVYLRHSRNIFVQYECVAKNSHFFLL